MSEALAGKPIFAAEKGAANTAGDAVIIGRVIKADLLTSWNRHDDSFHGTISILQLSWRDFASALSRAYVLFWIKLWVS